MTDPISTESGHLPFTYESGPVQALLIHGFLGSPRELRPLAESLAGAGVTAHGVLLPGFGPDLDRLKTVRAEEWLETARGEWTRIRQEADRAILVGYSMGGAVAMNLATEPGLAPDELILLAPHWRFADPRARLLPLAKHVLREFRPFTLADFANPDAREIFAAMAPGADLDDPAVRRQLIRDATIPTAALDELRRVGVRAASSFSRLTGPTTILQGLQDTTTLPAHSRTLSRKTVADLREFPGGHMIVDPAKPSWPFVRDAVVDLATRSAVA